MSFIERILDSVATKFHSILNAPFEQKYIKGLFSLGSVLILSSNIYMFCKKAEAKYNSDNLNVSIVFEFGPENWIAIFGVLLVAISIILFRNTRKDVKPDHTLSSFEKMIVNDVDSINDTELHIAFKNEHKVSSPSNEIRFLAKMQDPLLRIIDYKKGRSHIEFDKTFKIKNKLALDVKFILSIILYYLSSILCIGSIQLAAISFKIQNPEMMKVFLISSVCLSSFAWFNLIIYSGIASARRLVDYS
ncbi:hypothetical protein [Pseudoalteromonas tunicata]|nr:hypothetical protein [Pseudoalteromonas tunicata]ATC94177.1 hypothetical protein PTUN_a1564 [Pseudoalteromonas tunicata]AXT29939.1 hypothetical protein D1819_03405 [Pseudoalteromonas tunicata]